MNWQEIIFFFVLFGISGITLEVFCTAIQNFKHKKNRCLVGTSSIWMFLVYGSSFFIILLVATYFSNLNILVRGLIYTLLFYTLEFCSGSILKKCKAIPWNYSTETKYNLDGIIRLEFIPVWFICGLLAEAVYLYFNSHLIF
jgi:hypothetical protein